jgi:hypothetical protein
VAGGGVAAGSAVIVVPALAAADVGSMLLMLVGLTPDGAENGLGAPDADVGEAVIGDVPDEKTDDPALAGACPWELVMLPIMFPF